MCVYPLTAKVGTAKNLLLDKANTATTKTMHDASETLAPQCKRTIATSPKQANNRYIHMQAKHRFIPM